MTDNPRPPVSFGCAVLSEDLGDRRKRANDSRLAFVHRREPPPRVEPEETVEG